MTNRAEQDRVGPYDCADETSADACAGDADDPPP
jgi:hypothetical protein